MSAAIDVAAMPSAKSPFPFLDFYAESDASRFAGRDEEISSIVTAISSQDTYVVYGRSGLGKTSLILAGIFPQLKQRGYESIYLRVLESPATDLRVALAGADAASMSEDDLLAYVARMRPCVLALDQFEEFFIRFRHSDSEREAFIRLLGAVLRNSAGRLRLLFGIREDYYAELGDFRGQFPNIGDGYRLLPLTAYGARKAILIPLELSAIPYEQTLVNRLIDEVAAFGFDPLLLQIIATEVWKQAVRRNAERVAMTVTDFDAVGGFTGIFRGYVEAISEGVADEHQLLVRTILDTLTTAERTKRPMRSSDLARVYFRATAEEIEQVLNYLVSRRLVRRVAGNTETWFELLHDRLVPVIEEWLTLDHAFVNFRFAKSFVSNFAGGEQFRQGAGFLLSGQQLQELVEPWSERLQLSERETELIFRSAVNACLPSVKFWSKRLNEYGEQLSLDIVVGMFQSRTESVRASAVAMVPYLNDATEVVPALLHIALADESADVRSAASKSFALIATDEQLGLLAGSLKDERWRDRAVNVLAEYYGQLRSTQSFPLRARMRAWRVARRRVVHAERDKVSAATKTGALRGGIAGIAWVLCVVVPFLCVIVWNFLPGSVLDNGNEFNPIIMIAGVATMIFGASGTFIGAFVGRRESRAAAFATLQKRTGGPARGYIQSLTAFAIAGFASALIFTGDDELPPGLLLGLLIATLAVSAISALSLLGFGRVRSQQRERRFSIWSRLQIVVASIASVAVAAAVVTFHLLPDRYAAWLLMTTLVTILSTAVTGNVVLLCGLSTTKTTLRSATAAAVLCSSGPPLLLLLLVLVTLAQFEQKGEGETIVLVALVATFSVLIGSFRGAVVGSVAPQREARLTPAIRRTTSIAVAITILILIVGYLGTFGWRSIPMLAARRSTTEQLKGKLPSQVPTAHYYVIRPPSGPDPIVREKVMEGSVDVNIGERASIAPHVIFRPALLAVTAERGYDRAAGRLMRPYSVSFETVHPPEDRIQAPNGNVVVTLLPTADPSLWRGQLEGPWIESAAVITPIAVWNRASGSFYGFEGRAPRSPLERWTYDRLRPTANRGGPPGVLSLKAVPIDRASLSKGDTLPLTISVVAPIRVYLELRGETKSSSRPKQLRLLLSIETLQGSATQSTARTDPTARSTTSVTGESRIRRR
jgi:hypothetical protein